MLIVQVPIGGDGATASLSLENGESVLSIRVPIQAEVDKLMDALALKVPDAIKPLVAMLKAAADAELSKA